MSEIIIKLNKESSRLASNLINQATEIAQTTAMALAKKEVYKRLLKQAELQETRRHLLCVKDRVNSFTGKGYVRNNIIFRAGSVEIEFIDILINVSRENTIIRTPITGRRGTVKEYVGATDYSFDITGSMISDSQNGFPIEALEDFISVFETEGALEVVSELLKTFNVTRVSLENYSINQQDTRFANTINFKMKLISDETDDYKLTIE